MKILSILSFLILSSAWGLPLKDLKCEPYKVSNPWLEDVAIVEADQDNIIIKFEAFPLRGKFYDYPGSEMISYELEQTDSQTGWSWMATLSLREYGKDSIRFLTVTEARGGSKIRHEYHCTKK